MNWLPWLPFVTSFIGAYFGSRPISRKRRQRQKIMAAPKKSFFSSKSKITPKVRDDNAAYEQEAKEST